jgi:hypothetical protein
MSPYIASLGAEDIVEVAPSAPLDRRAHASAPARPAVPAASARLTSARRVRDDIGSDRSDHIVACHGVMILVFQAWIRLEREAIPPIPREIAALMRDVSTVGKLVE